MKAKVERIVSERDGTILSHVWLLFTLFVCFVYCFVLSCVIYQDLDGVLPRVTIISLTSQKSTELLLSRTAGIFHLPQWFKTQVRLKTLGSI